MRAAGDRALSARKAEHLKLAASGAGEIGGAGWADVHLIHTAIPQVELDDIDLRTVFLGRRLKLPLLISGMTGGHRTATRVNAALAAAAEICGCAMGVGSQRAALRSTDLAGTYTVARKSGPHVLLLANIGLPQLVPQKAGPGLTAADVRRVITMLQADALAVHLNYLQECVQPEGQTRTQGALRALRAIVKAAGVPVIAKETGSGITRPTALRLRALGVAAIDVGGRGGTSFALVECQRAHRQGDTTRARLGEVFAEWGVPTPAAVADCARIGLPLVATGGIRSGLDGAKALALGASLVGVARPLLQAALISEAAVVDWLRQFELELRVAMFLCDARSVRDLRGRAVVTGVTAEWIRQLRRRRAIASSARRQLDG